MIFAGTHQIGRRHPEILAFHPDIQPRAIIVAGFCDVRNLPFGPPLQLVQERVDHGAGIKSGRRKFVQQNSVFGDLGQCIFPALGYRAFLREQRTCAELESDLSQFRIVDPVFPIAQTPNSASHDNRQIV